MTTLTHPQRLEAENIDILREAVSETEKPVCMGCFAPNGRYSKLQPTPATMPAWLVTTKIR